MLGLLKAVPHRFVVLFFTHALAFSLGLAYANSWATRTALEVQADVFSKREADVGRALLEQQQKVKARAEQQRAQEQQANQIAYNILMDGMEEAAAGRVKAERELAQESQKAKLYQENIGDLLNVQKMLIEEFPPPAPPPSCTFSSGLRDTINNYIASSNRDIAARAAEAGGPGLSANPAPPDSVPLTCDEVARRILGLVEHDANSMLRSLSGEVWAKGVLK